MPAKRTKRTVKPKVETRSPSRIIGAPMSPEEIQEQITRGHMGSQEEIDLRFDSCLLNTQYSVGGIVAHGIREIVAYGTAVMVEKARS